MKKTQKQIADFRKEIYTYYQDNKRNFPWRNTSDPYCIFVSEIMLQQTQTDRVIDKYNEFIRRFPDFETLAKSTFHDILIVWKGLGYNRRAKWIHECAKLIVENYDGTLPDQAEELEALPGIGRATARSLLAFAYNKDVLFIETNIRTVFIHYFFDEKDDIHDNEIIELLKKTYDKGHARDWYSALMDYGVFLKKEIGNLNTRSRHYSKQSKFEGSDRQIRGRVIDVLLKKKCISVNDLAGIIDEDRDRVQRIVEDMLKEKLIAQDKKNGMLGL